MKQNVRQTSMLRFKDRVPSKVGRTTRGDDLAVRASLEEDRLCTGTCAVRKSTKCPRGAGRETVEHAVET
jgi:hypothetical protein